MNREIYDGYIAILKHELVPALGCPEPIAIAFAAAKARDVLGRFPEHITTYLSGNIIKNVKSVIVPNSGGQRGIEVAATLGCVGGDAGRAYEVLDSVTSRAPGNWSPRAFARRASSRAGTISISELKRSRRTNASN